MKSESIVADTVESYDVVLCRIWKHVFPSERGLTHGA